MTLTPQQLETAARRLCELREPDINPDDCIVMSGGFKVAFWKYYAKQIEAHLQILEAINFAMEPPESEEARNHRLIQERNRAVITMEQSRTTGHFSRGLDSLWGPGK